jgi:hypothetical protein
MVETALSSIGSMDLANLSSHGLLIVGAPILGFLTIKIFLFAKAASTEKKPREWVFGQERDENGLPLLATVKAPGSRGARQRAR